MDLEKKFKLPEDIIIQQKDDKLLFLDPTKPDWVITNHNGGFILSLLNGENSIGYIYSILESHPFGEEGKELLNKLITSNFFTVAHKQQDYKSRLNSVHLNVTENCNLNCVYCYATQREKESVKKLSVDNYKDLLNDLKSINNNIQISFTGGEPLLYDKLFDVAKQSHNQGFYNHLLTNGMLINKNNINLIISHFNEIRISIDGTESTHEYHRGQKTYNTVMETVELLEKNNANYRIAMTVTRKNISEIEQMANRFNNKLFFQPLFKAGNARENDLSIEGDEYFYALKNAKGVEPYSQIGHSLNSLRNIGCIKCSIGDGEISISHDGKVYPCHMLHLPQFQAGSIKEKSILEIYHTSDLLDKLRNQNVNNRENCRVCPIRLLCGGGCRARTFYTTGDINAADSFCEYEFLAFTEGLFNS